MNTIEKLFTLAHLFLPAFLEAHKKEVGKRTGIALAIQHQNAVELKHVRKIGTLDDKRFHEKSAFARDKIYRMYETGDLCSFQSEDETKGQFGGGIRTKDFLIAPSGLPPHLDQEFAIQLAMLAGELCCVSAIAIKAVSYKRIQYWMQKK